MPLRSLFRRAVLAESLNSLPNVANVPPVIEEEEVVEYQLSEINDNGEFVPPPQTEKKRSFWQSYSSSSLTSPSSFSLASTVNHRSNLSDSEPFNMSRESFDSYRRSFDIRAPSPISQKLFCNSADSMALNSMASMTSLTHLSSQAESKSSLGELQQKTDWPEDNVKVQKAESVVKMKEADKDAAVFEDIGLDENGSDKENIMLVKRIVPLDEEKPTPIKRKSLFARLAARQ